MFCARILLLFTLFCFKITSLEPLLLRDNLAKAVPGDYLVISSNKIDTLMHIYAKKDSLITIEEITIPECKRTKMDWKEWIKQNAPENTSWVMYEIDTTNGEMKRYYSFSKKGWFEIPDTDNFLSKLLNLRFYPIPEKMRKKVGPKPTSGPDWRPYWQPCMMIDGKPIKDVTFSPWKTKWPKDSSELSGKTIEVYLPQNNEKYPSYFPYWLQISGVVGKAKIRIIDSGRGMSSPKPNLDSLSSAKND